MTVKAVISMHAKKFSLTTKNVFSRLLYYAIINKIKDIDQIF